LKLCYKCKELKEFAAYGKNKSRKDGCADECKECKRTMDNAYAVKNRDKVKQRASIWYYANLDKARASNKTYNSLWVRINKGKNCAKASNYRTRKLNASPPWLTEEDYKNIQTEYLLAQWTSSVMNSQYHVDHIVPLQGKKVCGLHVPWNLQVIPAITNIQKGNRIVL